MQKISLTAQIRTQMEEAKRASSGRSAHTLHGGHDQALRQTLITLLGGRELDDHESPGESTIHVLQGRVRLATAEASWDGIAGDYLIIPGARHRLAALVDSAVLLTVVKQPQTKPDGNPPPPVG
jgi:quercetin dioxygenase-like cupin family protein